MGIRRFWVSLGWFCAVLVGWFFVANKNGWLGWLENHGYRVGGMVVSDIRVFVECFCPFLLFLGGVVGKFWEVLRMVLALFFGGH